MSATVERAANALAKDALSQVIHEKCAELSFPRQARAALESLREPDPHVIARAADRLGIPPTEAAKLAGMWIVMVEEMLRLDTPSRIPPNQAGS